MGRSWTTDLAARPEAVVLLVLDAERAVQLHEACDSLVVVDESAGGALDFDAFVRRRIILWPGHGDDPAVLRELARELVLAGAVVRFVQHPEQDEEVLNWNGSLTEADVERYIRLYLHDLADEFQDPAENVVADAPAGEVDSLPEENAVNVPPADQFFRCLGHDRGRYYFWCARQGQVLAFSAQRLGSLAGLYELAPVWWMQRRYGNDDGRIPAAMAGGMLINQCAKVGVYNPELVRGVGAWWDEGRPVVHLGDRLFVEGAEVELDGFESRYLYERKARIRGPSTEMLPSKEAQHVLEVARMLPWERSISATFLAGWIMQAIVCGAAEWRPHLWITGAAGVGKSWILTHVVARVLGDFAVYLEGDNSAAGIRQTVKQDARPVLLDEAEAHKHGDHLQGILDLMRASSSETGAHQVRGSVSGEVREYMMRCSFCLGSIGVGFESLADDTRITVLTLRALPTDTRAERVKADAAFTRIKEGVEQFTPEYCAKLQARAIGLLPRMRQNAATFGRAVSLILGSQRLGDQYGALLAGAWALKRADLVSTDEAQVWVEKRQQAGEWDEYTAASLETDEDRCLAAMLEATVNVESPSGWSTRTIGELIEKIATVNNEGIKLVDARDCLRRHGIAVELGADKLLYVANRHQGMRRLMADTRWKGGQWTRTLLRVPGASATPSSISFAGSKSRAVAVPLAAVLDPDTPTGLL